jgi:hypothetical protein
LAILFRLLGNVILAILFRIFGLLAFKIISVSDENYSRNSSCALHLISTFILL